MSHRILRVVVLVVVAILPLRVSPVAADSASMPAITAIAAGSYHTCALTSGGGVKCWGNGSWNQVGNATTTDSVPVDVAGLTRGVTAIAAGDSHTCALTIGGGVKCWGYNANGLLGNGSTSSSSVPVDVSGLASGVSAIAAGADHTCALTGAGGVKCWGSNVFGGLGNGSSSDGRTPVIVSVVAGGVAAIAAGHGYTCALTIGGGVKCWGYNHSGQLGNGTTTDSFSAVDVSGLASGVSAIAAGAAHTCALTIGGGVECWGSNGAGELGDGSTTNRSSPVNVSSLASGVRAIAAGNISGHTCALTNEGGVRCWGYNEDGQLGSGSAANSSVPVDVVGLASGVEAVAVGYTHTCALTSGGGVKCWGRNYEGQLGSGTRTGSLTPVDVDFASQEPPQTNTADRGVRDRPADFPFLPLLAGIGAGIAMLVRPRAREGDDRCASAATAKQRPSRSSVSPLSSGTRASAGLPRVEKGPRTRRPG